MYIVVKDDDFDVYEIVRVDEERNCIVMQTNIRTQEKANQACKAWQERERAKYE